MLLSMIFSENRFTLFRIMLVRRCETILLRNGDSNL
jgi:hypothetical protein